MARKSSKKAILEAAERVILRQGLAGTTIEAVAAEAGMSKGGLFYHFARKKDLLLQLMEKYEEEFVSLREEIRSSLPEGPGNLLKATILASVHGRFKANRNFSNMVTLLDDMDLRSKYAAMRRKLFDELTLDYPYPEKVALALVGTDGYLLMEIFGEAYPAEVQDKILDQLLQLIDRHTADDLGIAAMAAAAAKLQA